MFDAGRLSAGEGCFVALPKLMAGGFRSCSLTQMIGADG